MLVAALCFSFYALHSTGITSAIAAGENPNQTGVSKQATDPSGSSSLRTMEQRIEEMEKALNKTEERSYDNKMMARELISYVKLVVAVLVAIALVFPLTIWVMSKKRILGLSGLSPELATTLLVVEERQAKLAVILKEIQGEIDYLHTMSVPDLKNLIQQAENYLKQNETDLGKAGRPKGKAETGQS
jgi:hypothetical protein